MQPNIFETTLQDFNKPNYRSNSALSLGEQLYTPKGSQSAGVGEYVADYLNVDPKDWKQSILLQMFSGSRERPNMFYRKRPIWTMNQVAAFTMRDRNVRGGSDPTVLVSLPEYNRLVAPNTGLNDTRWERIMVTLKEPSDKVAIKRLND